MLAVTVGFDTTIVLRTLARLGAGEVVFLYAVTGNPEDVKSRNAVENLRAVLKAGTPVPVDLRDPASALREIHQVPFQSLALAGGPRLLIVLAFVAAALKGAKIYVAPEYSNEVVDISPLASIIWLPALGKAKLKILSLLSKPELLGDIAKNAGVDVSTASRHLKALEKAGLVEVVRGSVNIYRANPLVVELARLLNQNANFIESK